MLTVFQYKFLEGRNFIYFMFLYLVSNIVLNLRQMFQMPEVKNGNPIIQNIDVPYL